MQIHLGNQFDGQVFSPTHSASGGQIFCGEKKLLAFLETQLGLSGYPANTDYLRIELYRQSLGQHLTESPNAFFAQSFDADRFATATALLDWRDELLLAGWDFSEKPDLPERLQNFAAVEKSFRKKLAEPPANVQAFGFADRFDQALRLLPERIFHLEKIWLHEPESLFLPHIQRFIKIVSEKSIAVEAVPEANFEFSQKPNLAALQRRLAGEKLPKMPGDPDGSLLILRAKRDSDAATFLAQLLAENPKERPVFVVPEMNLLLEQALVQEGFPQMGILSASLARPSLQVLKLAPAFIWEPVDVFKIMEFVTLPVKPMDDGLAATVAKTLAEKPGLFNDTWFARVFGYLEDENTPEEAREQYKFWFDRRRYPADGLAPKRDISLIYNFLREWASDFYDKSSGKNSSLLVLAEQARRVHDLLQAIPETRLGYLDLERIVRTIYEPAPAQFAPPSRGHFEFVHSSGAFAGPAPTVFWWNCLFDEPTPTPEKWMPDERQFLENQGIALAKLGTQPQRRLLLRNRPVRAASERLVLVVPESANGSASEPSLLLGDIEAAFEQPERFNFHLENAEDRKRLAQFFRLPGEALEQVSAAENVQPHLQFSLPELLQVPEYETLTSLESLFYYPHRWFLKSQTQLFPTSILSVTGENTLFGNLAHRFFELLLTEPLALAEWDKPTVADWFNSTSQDLLEREGATLLLYGREPEKNQFLNRVKNAAWSLIYLLRDNGWAVEQAENEYVGQFWGIQIKGKPDLVLVRGPERAVVDLKWSGLGRRQKMIQSQEDLQLVLYSKLAPPEEKWAHSAYFILENGRMVARNNEAFRQALVAGSGDDHRTVNSVIFNKMELTFRWRMEQLRRGLLEIRTARTLGELDVLYAEELLELLEMKGEAARWDDFKTLVG